MERLKRSFKSSAWARRGWTWPLALALLLLLGGAIRVMALNWGLPNQAFYHALFVPDETSELIATLMLGDRLYQYPVIRLQPFFYFLSFLYFACYFFIALLSGRVDSWAEYMAWQRADLAHFILVGRVFIVILAVATIFMTFVVGRRLFDRRTGLISAAALTLSLGHVTYSRTFRLDSIMPFLVIVGLYLLLRILYAQEEKLRWYILAGFVVAAAAATKLTGFALLFPLLLIPFLDPNSDSMWPIRRPVFSRPYVFTLFVCLASYVAIAGPAHVMRLNLSFDGDLSQAPRSIAGMASRFSRTESFRKLGGISTFEVSLPFHLTSSLPRLLGLTTYLMALLGTAFLLFERRKRAGVLLLLCTLFAFLLPIGVLQRASDRDVLPLLPVLALCTGYAIERLLAIAGRALAAGGRQRWTAVIVAVVLLLVLMVPLLNVVRHSYLLLQTDTRDMAAAWIEANIPAGTALLTEPYGPGIMGGAPEGGAAGEGELTTLDGRPVYRIYDLLEGTSDGADDFDPDQLRPYLDVTDAEYVIVSSGYYQRFYNAAMGFHFPEHAEQGRAFHDRIASELELVTLISPDWQSRPGPVIQIYRVPETAAGQRGGAAASFEPYPGFDRDIRAIGYGMHELKWPWLRVERWDDQVTNSAEQSEGRSEK